MNQSQLVELINTLSENEKEGLWDFAQYSFLGNGKVSDSIKILLEICLKEFSSDHPQNLTKQEIFLLVFPGQKTYIEGKLEKLMVEAHKLVKNYLLVKHYFRSENEFNRIKDFVEITQLLGLEGRTKNYLSRLKKFQESDALYHLFYYHDEFLVEYLIHADQSFHNQFKNDLNISNVLDSLDKYMYFIRIALLNAYLIQQKAMNIEMPNLIEKLLVETIVPQKYLDGSPLLNIYNTIFLILQKKMHDLDDVQNLFSLIKLNENKFNGELLNGLYAFLRNTCTLILLQQPERIDAYNINFELYKLSLEKGLLHYNGKLHPSRYKAINDYASKVQEFEWGRTFLEKYKDEIIGENESRDIYHFNLAQHLFAKGEFEQCLELIPPTSPFVDYLFAGKRLEIKAYYETKSDLLHYKLDAFKMFVLRTSRKLLPQERYQSNLDFLNLLVQINTSIPGDKKRADKLIERIKEKKQAAEWMWLMAKAGELKENK